MLLKLAKHTKTHEKAVNTWISSATFMKQTKRLDFFRVVDDYKSGLFVKENKKAN